MFCYLKQEEAKGVSQYQRTWIAKQLHKMLPKIGNLFGVRANLTKLTPLKEPLSDAVEDNNNELSEIDTNLPTNDKPEQSSSKPLDESEVENITKKTSFKEPTQEDITTTNNVTVEKNVEPLPEDKLKSNTND